LIPILAGYVSHENGHPVPEAAILADLPGFPHSLNWRGLHCEIRHGRAGDRE
jgi:hypothetical protein